jgi:hypothetical protein
MYFAALLFNMTLLIAIVVSLATKPDDEYRVRENHPDLESSIRCRFHQHFYTAFTRKIPKSITIQSRCQYLFALLGSARIKALHKMSMKLTPSVSLYQLAKLDEYF